MRSPTVSVLVTILCIFSLQVWAVPHGGSRNSSASRVMSPLQHFPPINYQPKPSGIPYTIKNQSAQPWLYRTTAPITHSALAEEDSVCTSSSNSSGYWYEQIDHNGQSSFMDSKYKDNYNVFRNVVKDFGADNTGQKDAAAAISAAIKAGPSNGPDRSSNSMGTTGQPAIIYLPAGTYLMKSSLQLYLGTVIIGDPTNPPVLKASSDFADDHIIYAKDPNFGGTINFYLGIKNIIIDSTGVGADKSITLLDWTVSQATQLTNVGFNMPTNTAKHVGLTTQYDYNSNLILNDLWFKGGATGMKLSGQQWVFKNISFSGTTTGVVAGGTDIVFLGCRFEQGTLGIDAQGTSGSLTVVDTTGVGMGTLISSSSSNTAGNSIVLDNVQNSGATVKIGGQTTLSGNVANTWVHGHLYTSNNAKFQSQQGQTVTTSRSSSLLSGKNYFTMAPPTYKEYSTGQVLNIKNVPGIPVYGDGETDDTRNINLILSRYKTSCSLMYFPAGTYIVTDTIFVPAGTRIIGDAYASTISAVGSNFEDESAPRAMILVGYPGDVGVAQISDMVFTVADVLPGCKLVEVNIAARSPGDVGFWNSHFRIGGAAGSQVESLCTDDPNDCKAAWGLLHLTSTSSAYIENMWGWTADHDLDGDNPQTISTGRGLLVEGTAATWLIGTGSEHNTLYQYNFQYARNVFTAMQQSETPYWQGAGSRALNPTPWQYLDSSDPDFSNCAANDSKCRMALFERIYGSSDLFLYGGCNWVFFNNNGDCSGDCQTNAIDIANSTSIYLYGTNTKSTTNMILEGTKVIATQNDNAGGWGGVIAGYLYDS